MEVIENKKLMQFFFQGKKWKEIDKPLYRRHLSKIRACSSQKELSSILEKIEPQVARAYTYKLLSMRDYLSGGLAKKLVLKKISPKVIGEILEECQKKGYVNDEKFICSFIEKSRRKGWGPIRIQKTLIQKGASFEILQSLKWALSPEEEREELEKWVAKKWPTFSRGDSSLMGKIFRFLRQKGFSDEEIRKFLFK